jgi:glutamyl-tRNA reductase
VNDRALPPPLALVGCDFRVASTAWRGALALDSAQRRDLSASLASAAGARGLVVLETCNRTEWVVEADQADWAAGLLRAWMQRLWRERVPAAAAVQLPRPRVRLETEAARHFIRVAAGLESFVLGEREIAAQVNRALESAREDRTASSLLNELGQSAARTVRRVEKASRFRETGHGVHSLVLDRVGRHAACLRRRLRVGVAGMGAIGRRTATALEQVGLAPALLFNRTVTRDKAGAWRSLDDLAGLSTELDVLVVATGARCPVVAAGALAGAGRDAPLLVLDLGSPAQVLPPETGEAAVLVEGLDELLDATHGPADVRDRESAEQLVDEGLEEFLLAWRKSPAGALLRHVQQSRDELGADRLPGVLDEHLADLPQERRRRLEKALRGLVLERDQRLLEHLMRAVGPTNGSET